MCDPPGIVSVQPSVVLDLLHPRSAGSSSLALPLRPDVRFTACATSTNRRSAEWAGVASGSRRTWPKMESRLRQIRIAKPSSPVWLVTEALFLRSIVGNSCGTLLIAIHQHSGESMSQSHITVRWWQGHCRAVSSSVNLILSASRCWRVCQKYLKLDQYARVSLGWNAQTSGYHCQDMWSGLWSLQRDLVIALELVLPHDLSSGSWFSTRRYSDPSYVQLHQSLTGCTAT